MPTTLVLPEIKLVGFSTRTENAAEFDASTAKIAPLVRRYMAEAPLNQVKNRVTPGRTFSAFAEYESDHTGSYTYFIGEEVSSFDGLPEDLARFTIPPQKYARFSNGPGPMPLVCVDLWQLIWRMDSDQLGGRRCYVADFEIYDERATDPQYAVLDIYIGIENGAAGK